MKVEAYITISDPKTGKVESRKKANSLLVIFTAFWKANFTGFTTVTTYKDIANADRTVTTGCSGNPAVGDVDKGIIAGTGVAAVTISDYKIGTIIPHGNAAGQLSYGAGAYTDPVVAGSTASFTVSRTLTNGSGADIDVTEVALYGAIGGIGRCFDRTLNSFTVPNGGAKTVTYTFSVTV